MKRTYWRYEELLLVMQSITENRPRICITDAQAPCESTGTQVKLYVWYATNGVLRNRPPRKLDA